MCCNKDIVSLFNVLHPWVHYFENYRYVSQSWNHTVQEPLFESSPQVYILPIVKAVLVSLVHLGSIRPPNTINIALLYILNLVDYQSADWIRQGLLNMSKKGCEPMTLHCWQTFIHHRQSIKYSQCPGR